jgi:hypothetical protein
MSTIFIRTAFLLGICLVTTPATAGQEAARATVRVHLSDIEYSACSADPERDQPLRALALQQTDGDAWAAMRLLVDPAWHHAQTERLTSHSAETA